MFTALRFRLAIILVAAVIPAAVVSCLIAYNGFVAARNARQDALLRETHLLGSRLDAMADSASRTATLLSLLLDAGHTEQGCASIMEAVKGPGYLEVGIVERGTLICNMRAKEPSRLQDLVAIAVNSVAIGKTLIRVEPTPRESTPGDQTMWAAARGTGVSSERIAIVVVNRDIVLEALGSFRSTPSSRAVLTDRSGHILLPSDEGQAVKLWSKGQISLLDRPTVFTEKSSVGVSTTYTTEKLSGLDAWLVTAQKRSDIARDAERQLILATIEPLVLLIVALAAIWFGLNREVLRWVSQLRETAAAYASGNLAARAHFKKGPREFLELSQAFDSLADRVAQRTQDLEREIAAKSSYIRELHHRVKNNLQVIGSLLSLQSRELPQAERQVLQFPTDRVNAMSAAYRASYAVPEGAQASIESVLREVAQRLQAINGPGGLIELDLIGGDLRIHLDDAITLAMLLAELLPAFVDAGIEHDLPVELTLAASPERLELRIKGPEVNRQTLQLSRRFIQAYLKLLGASLDERWPDETRGRGAFSQGENVVILPR